MKKRLKLWTDRCGSSRQIFSYETIKAARALLALLVQSCEDAARMEALFELGGCRTAASLLLPAGALRKKL